MAGLTPVAEPGINARTLYKELGFKPHSAGQSEYLYSDARFNIPCCGRRYGKSQVAGRRMTKKMFTPDTYNWICAPSYRLGEKEFRVVWQDFNKLGILKYCKKGYSLHQGDMYIDTPWNAHLMVVSAERQDSLLGEGLSHVIMSEAAKHSRNTWEQYIEPALSDLRGSADFPSTPQGFNWFHGLWQLGQPGPEQQPQYRSWRFPTWENIVRYPGGYDDPEIQRLKQRTSPLYFDQEYGAQFTAMTGSIYDEWNDNIHIQRHEFNPRWSNYLAFDYGYANPFVCLDVQIAPDDTIYVWREYVSRYQSTMEHGAFLKNRPQPQDYNVVGMWGDPRGPDAAATLALIIGFVASQDVPWKHGIEFIKNMLKNRKLFIDPSCTNTIQSISQLHVKPPSRSGITVNETVGDGNIQHKIDDHCADALRYLLGPLFVLGMGSHFADEYDYHGQSYQGSESQDFFKLHSSMTLDSRDSEVFTKL